MEKNTFQTYFKHTAPLTTVVFAGLYFIIKVHHCGVYYAASSNQNTLKPSLLKLELLPSLHEINWLYVTSDNEGL